MTDLMKTLDRWEAEAKKDIDFYNLPTSLPDISGNVEYQKRILALRKLVRNYEKLFKQIVEAVKDDPVEAKILRITTQRFKSLDKLSEE